MRGRRKRNFVFVITIAGHNDYMDIMENSGNPFVKLSEKERLNAFIEMLSAVYEESPGYKSEKVMKRLEFNSVMGESVVC